MSARSLRALAVAVALLGAAVAVVGVVAAARTVAAWRETLRIQHGPHVLAVIASTGRVTGFHQRVRLRYADDAGVHHDLDVRYPLGRAKSVLVGTATSVAYDPDAPGRAELAGHPRHTWQDAALVLALVAVAAGGALRWSRLLLLAAGREEDAPEIRLGRGGTVERTPRARRRVHTYGTLAVASVLLLAGGRLVVQLVSLDRPQEVAFPPLPVLPRHQGPVVLPAALTAPAPRSGPLVTPTTARTVAAAAWQFRDRAIANHDLAALRAIDAEPAAAVDAGALEAGDPPNRPDPVPGDLHDLTAFVPRQASWPARILAEAVTRSADDRPALEVMVLTRGSANAHWRVALDTMVIGSATYVPRVDPPILDAAGYDLVPAPDWIAPSEVVPSLARYWQSWRDTGRPPATGPAFADGYWTNGYGATIANLQDRRDPHNDLRAHVVYGDRPAPRDEVWTFGVFGTWLLVCSPLHEAKTWTGPAHQDANRQKWGAGLAPGVYRTITGEFVREVCADVPAKRGGIVVFGADAWGVGLTGER
jgi:hypothetical protein